MECWKRRLKSFSSYFFPDRLRLRVFSDLHLSSRNRQLRFNFFLRNLVFIGGLLLASRIFFCFSPCYAVHFKHNAAGLNNATQYSGCLYRNPFGSRPASGNGLVGEYLYPDLAAALDVSVAIRASI